MGAVLLQHGKPIAFHSETFNDVVTNYPTYEKEIYVFVHSVKKWKHCLMGKETIIHTDHQPLQYLQSQTNCSNHVISGGWDLFNSSLGYKVQERYFQ